MKNYINFDQIRYIELLKKEEILINDDRSLFDENPEEDNCHFMVSFCKIKFITIGEKNIFF